MPKYIVANWKQNKNLSEVKEWINEFEELIKDKEFKNTKIIIAPSFVHLPLVKEFTESKDYLFSCAQDVSKENGGRFTGQVSAFQVADFCDYSILGHSETGDIRDDVFKKGSLCLEAGINPIICFVDKNEPIDIPNVIFAWEDPENITKEAGNYNPKSTDAISTGISEVKANKSSDSVVLYGGSVNRENASDLSRVPDLDGVLVGSASLDPKHFFDIVTAFEI